LYVRCLDRYICLEQCNAYFPVIGQIFHELGQLGTRHSNARKFLCGFIPDQVYAGLRVELDSARGSKV